MPYESVIRDLETFLSLYSVSFGTGNARREAAAPARVAGAGPAAEELKRLPAFAEQMANDEMIEAILDHCSDQTLDDLVQAFGEDSQITRLIRSRQYGLGAEKIPCELDAIERNVKQMLREARHGANPLYENIVRHMEKRGFETDADFYKSINMPRQQFARLRDARNALSKQTMLWIIAGLRLNYQEAAELLRKAGYFFRKNDMRDVILSYIFRNTSYDLDMVNQVLHHFDLQPLC